jgi:hypothetical protein
MRIEDWLSDGDILPSKPHTPHQLDDLAVSPLIPTPKSDPALCCPTTLPINYNLNYGKLNWATVKTVNYRCYPNERPAFPQNLPLILSASSTTRSRLKFKNNQLANMPLNLPYLASGSSWTLGSCIHQRPTLALTLQQIGWFVSWMVSILIS